MRLQKRVAEDSRGGRCVGHALVVETQVSLGDLFPVFRYRTRQRGQHTSHSQSVWTPRARRSRDVQKINVPETISKLTRIKSARLSWPRWTSSRARRNKFWRCSRYMTSLVYNAEPGMLKSRKSLEWYFKPDGYPAKRLSWRLLSSL